MANSIQLLHEKRELASYHLSVRKTHICEWGGQKGANTFRGQVYIVSHNELSQYGTLAPFLIRSLHRIFFRVVHFFCLSVSFLSPAPSHNFLFHTGGSPPQPLTNI